MLAARRRGWRDEPASRAPQWPPAAPRPRACRSPLFRAAPVPPRRRWYRRHRERRRADRSTPSRRLRRRYRDAHGSTAGQAASGGSPPAHAARDAPPAGRRRRAPPPTASSPRWRGSCRSATSRRAAATVSEKPRLCGPLCAWRVPCRPGSSSRTMSAASPRDNRRCRAGLPRVCGAWARGRRCGGA